MSKLVYNQLTDEVGGKKAPLSLHACKFGARITESDLTDCNWRLNQHNYLPTNQLMEVGGGT